MRIQLILEYDGTGYAGWQRQNNALTVQEVLERALFKLTGSDIRVLGASRTDAGVHAYGQSVHFDSFNSIPPEKYSYALNTILPDDVRVVASRRVAESFHARFSACGKRYQYSIWDGNHAPAINRNTMEHSIYALDEKLMSDEAGYLIGRHDFAAFAASGSAVRDTFREIYSAGVARNGKRLTLDISGTGFLYNMVRIIAGTLMSVGSGKLEPGAIKRAIESGNRLDLGPTAAAKGLALMEVFYPEEAFYI